jgi:hypothetical protein
MGTFSNNLGETMIKEKVDEKNASNDRPNPFAINVGNLLTGSNPERAIGDAIEKLVVQRKDWETNELAAANDGLYRLLQHCLAVNNAMSGTDSTAKALKKGLANYISEQKYIFNESTPLITKVVKCVFGVDRRRVSAYSSALRVAMAEKISVMELPKFFREHGGIEEVRRSATATKTKTLKDKVRLGRVVLENDVLAKVQSDNLNAHFSNSSLEEGVVLLATKEDDGSFAIRRVVQNSGAVNSALAACASIGQEKEKAQKLQDEMQAIEEERAKARMALKTG